MKIIILGAGRVGESVAESLVSERNDITVIDTDPARCARRCRTGWTCGAWWATASSPGAAEAGIEDADMLIACAPLDETNLVACKVAHDVFNVPTTIARLRSPEFENGSPLLGKTALRWTR
jgi:trk system potassium uptake protein TrkA